MQIKISQRTIGELEKIAKIVFPMEIEAALPIIQIGNEKWANEIRMPDEYGDAKAYFYSDDFDSLIKCLRNNDAPGFHFQIDKFRQEHEEAKRLFKNYKECQRRRKIRECSNKEMDLLFCSKIKCDTIGQPIRKWMYDWIAIPSIAWHSHVTSKYGDVAKLSIPSGADSYMLAKRIYFTSHPIEAEAITCISETGKQLTRLFNPPTKSFFKHSEEDRKEIKLNQKV